MRFLRTLALAAVMGLVLAGPASAAGTVTVTTQEVGNDAVKYMRYTVAWTSTAGGAVSGNAFSIVAGDLANIRFVPGTADNLYDVTLSDGAVSDLLAGLGANLVNTTSTLLSWSPAIFQDGSRTLDVVIANAGAATSGTVIIMIRTWVR